MESTAQVSSLREPGAILLISCYELGHQPIGIAQPRGFLEQAGYAPTGMDIAVEDFDEEGARRARFVGISVPMHTALRLGTRVAEKVRSVNPSCHICFYGLYASLNGEYLLRHVADSVIGGEYEIPLVRLVAALEQADMAGEDLQVTDLGIEGVSTRSRTVPPVLRRLPSSIPVPSRRGLPVLDRYARLDRDGVQGLVGYVEASRGCLHHCLHCPIVPVYGGRFVLVPEDSVLEDIRHLVAAGATHITFGDPDFLNGPGHSSGIVQAMHDEFPQLTFDFTAKIEHLLKRRALLPDFASMGCLFVISAVESFSDTVLTRLQKGHTREDVLKALDLVRSAGITLRSSLVPFTPWTSLDDYLELLELVDAHDLIDSIDPIQYSIRLLIPPGSALLRDPEIRELVGLLDEANFQYQWSHPDPRMDTLHQAVNTAVEEASQSEEDSATTFDRLRSVAYAVAGRVPPQRKSLVRQGVRPRPPRLTESWFCCAEPTAGQFRPLASKGLGEV